MLPNIVTKIFFNYYPSILEYTKLVFTSSLLGILFQFAFFKKQNNIKSLLIQSEITTILFFLIALPFLTILKRKPILFFIILLISCILSIVLLKKKPKIAETKKKYHLYMVYGFVILFYIISFLATII